MPAFCSLRCATRSHSTLPCSASPGLISHVRGRQDLIHAQEEFCVHHLHGRPARFPSATSWSCATLPPTPSGPSSRSFALTMSRWSGNMGQGYVGKTTMLSVRALRRGTRVDHL